MAQNNRRNINYIQIVETFEAHTGEVYDKNPQNWSQDKIRYFDDVIDTFNDGNWEEHTLYQMLETYFDEMINWDAVEAEYAMMYGEDQAFGDYADEDDGFYEE
jgi:hypothetical protein